MTFAKNHVALVCGGTAPIGLRLAIAMADAGCGNIAIAGRSAERGSDALAQLEAAAPGGRYTFVQTDIGAPGAVEAMFATVAETYGGLDSYVHCVPPGTARGPLMNADRDRFRASLGFGLGALADACFCAASAFRARGGGAMVLFASDAGRGAAPNHSLTGVVQGGIMALTRSFALELSRDRIRINCVSPTYVAETPLFDRLLQSPQIVRAIEKAEKRAGLGLPTPDDIAPLALFLLSAAASKITGQVVSVNGGLSA